MSYKPRHFTDSELACKHCGVNGCTDELMMALDDYREVVGRKVIVHDAYRCTFHNATVSLVAKSEHPLGMAADVTVPGLSLQEMYDAAKRVPAFDNGGIGVYDRKFVHLDTRKVKARWAFVGSKEEAASVLVTV